MASKREELTALLKILQEIEKVLKRVATESKNAMDSQGEPKTLQALKETEKQA